MILVITTI